MNRKAVYKKEICIIVLVLVACFVVIGYYYFKDNDKIALIYHNNSVYEEINLTKNVGTRVIHIESNDKHAHILVQDNKIGFIDYECPDGVCQSAGMIGNETQTAVCLPLKVSISIQGKSKEIIAG